MEISLTSEPIDKIHVDAIVADLYARDVPLKGPVGMLDWRMYGFFSKLLLDQKMTGRHKETYLVPLKNKAMAKNIVLVGLGTKYKLSERKVAAVIPDVLKTLRRLKIQNFVLVPLGWKSLGYTKALKVFLQEFHKSEPLFPNFYFKKMCIYVPESVREESIRMQKMLPFIQKRISHV
ncbi:MAG: hypothetical protein HYS98_08120 [Deltaproteobacteria bacterium]|nr:hypothetical protein [Deltaproteobacteria bacterium]